MCQLPTAPCAHFGERSPPGSPRHLQFVISLPAFSHSGWGQQFLIAVFNVRTGRELHPCAARDAHQDRGAGTLQATPSALRTHLLAPRPPVTTRSHCRAHRPSPWPRSSRVARPARRQRSAAPIPARPRPGGPKQRTGGSGEREGVTEGSSEAMTAGGSRELRKVPAVTQLGNYRVVNYRA